ncbi:MAG TPA: MXAN_5808 family serine peptidase [Kofleriaceae bacterium]|nr:MXAN_5808 family serine peptidase [Kofleriaceae bacterium]
MRRWLSLNGVLVGAAAVAALVLTVTRPSPEGLIDLGVGDREVRAAPGQPEGRATKKHNLAQLAVLKRTLIRVRENYVDPARIDPQKMLVAALDSVQFNIPEVMVAQDPSRGDVEITVNDKSARFDVRDVDSPWRLAKSMTNIVRFIEANMNAGADLAAVEYALVNGVLSTLDPHSILLDPEQAQEMDNNTSGSFGGLGIVIGMRKNKLTVLRPMKGTPAFKAGVLARDAIVKINDEVTENLTLNESVDRMRGKRGTKVVLWVERAGEPKLLRFEMTRAEIETPSVEPKMLTRGVGYIKLKQFSEKTAKDLSAALADLRKQGAKSYILDMRWNPGGLLEQAIQVGDIFLEQGTIVTTVGGNEREPRRAEHDDDDVVKPPLAVLVNGGSASASEIVAGALKNLDRAITIGTTTFGKGSVQILYNNDDSSKLKLTIAQYLTPGDLSIQSIGIVPDIELSRMMVPAQNASPKDWVRLLPPTKSYREKDLKSHLDSTYAVEGPKPDMLLSYLYEPPVKAPEDEPDAAPPLEEGDDEEGPIDPADEEEPLDDEFQMDFEIGFARDLLAEAGASTRKQTIKNSRKLVEKHRAVEVKKLSDKLALLGVDWSGPAQAGAATAPALDASFAIEGDGAQIRAGQPIKLTGKITNNGTAPAYRVMARVNSDDPLFDDNEMVFGKVDAGASRTWTTYLKVADEALDRLDHLDFEVRDISGVVSVPARPVALRVLAAPRPVFAYSHQLIDVGNGDGLVQPGESYKLRVMVKNIGKGEARETMATLRNVSGTDLQLKKAKFELGALKPGESRTVEFALNSVTRLENDVETVEMVVYDAHLREGVSEKLKYPVRKAAAAVSAASGVVRVGARPTTVFDGASLETARIATAPRGALFRVTGRTGDFLRVDLGEGRPGFVEAREVAKASGTPRPAELAHNWQVTPPTLSIEVPAYEVSSSTFTLRGKAVDETKIEDVYVFVSNQDAKIENRKVFYRSNRGSAKPTQMTFSPDIPLWPGSNLVTVVVRENDEVKSSQMMYLYRPKGETKAAAAMPK